jgi:cytochrome c oxidase subunit 2
MIGMMDYILPEASSSAKDIDFLIELIFVIVGVWLIAAEAILFYFVFKFRRKAGVKAEYITGEKHEEMKWIHIPHNLVLVFDIIIIVFAVKIWYEVKQYQPPADSTVRVIGQQWSWSFIDPGLDNILGTADDVETVDEFHLKVNTTYHFQLESRDVLHSFSIPAFRLKQDAVPGRVITGWFKPIKLGKYDFQCAEICGIGHGIMQSTVFVETAAEHEAWLKAHQPAIAAVSAPNPAPVVVATAPAEPPAPAEPATVKPAPAVVTETPAAPIAAPN